MLQLQEVVGADQAALDGVVTVPGQLKQLKLDKLQGTSGLEQVIARVISHWVHFVLVTQTEQGWKSENYLFVL